MPQKRSTTNFHYPIAFFLIVLSFPAERAYAWNLTACLSSLFGFESSSRSAPVSLLSLSLEASEATPSYTPVSPTTLIHDHPALLQSYRHAVEYFRRFQPEIERNLSQLRGDQRVFLEASLQKLIGENNLRPVTTTELWDGLLTMTTLRDRVRLETSSESDADYRARNLHYARATIQNILASGQLPLPVFRQEPLSQRDILLYQAALIRPLQIIDTPERADGYLRSSFEFLRHDLAHAENYLYELSRSDYPMLKRADGRSRLPEIAKARYDAMEQFLDTMPGIFEADRPYVVPLLFRVMHEGNLLINRNFTITHIPTDIRVLARYLRENSLSIPPANTPITRGNIAGYLSSPELPREVVQRILLAIAALSEGPQGRYRQAP